MAYWTGKWPNSLPDMPYVARVAVKRDGPKRSLCQENFHIMYYFKSVLELQRTLRPDISNGWERPKKKLTRERHPLPT